MQVIRDAILKPPYKRISMYVPVVTNCKADSPPMQFLVTRRSLWYSESESESREGSLCDEESMYSVIRFVAAE